MSGRTTFANEQRVMPSHRNNEENFPREISASSDISNVSGKVSLSASEDIPFNVDTKLVEEGMRLVLVCVKDSGGSDGIWRWRW